MPEEIKSIPIACPKCGEKTDRTVEGWTKHIKDKHPEIKTLRIGNEVINLKDEKRDKVENTDVSAESSK